MGVNSDTLNSALVLIGELACESVIVVAVEVMITAVKAVITAVEIFISWKPTYALQDVK